MRRTTYAILFTIVALMLGVCAAITKDRAAFLGAVLYGCTSGLIANGGDGND